MRVSILTGLLTCVSVPAQAEWRAANADVEAAAKTPVIAEVLAEAARVDAAIVAKDRAGFLSIFTDQTMVNSPANTVNGKAAAAAMFDRGFISYEYLRRSIEYAGMRANGEVVLMGEEAVQPRAPHPLAGKAVRRRFTDVWQKQGDAWVLSLRQATIFEVK